MDIVFPFVTVKLQPRKFVYKVRLLQKFVVSAFTTFPIRLLKELLKIILMVKGLQQMAKLEKNHCHHVLHTKKHYRKNIVVKRTRKEPF